MKEVFRLPKASPVSPSASPLFAPVSSSPQSQLGYSLSSFAKGASCPFTKPNPFNTVPAGTLLSGIGGVSFDEDSPGGMPGVLDGEGVNGVEKGWAADVEVAGGGSEALARTQVAEKAREWGRRYEENLYRRQAQR